MRTNFFVCSPQAFWLCSASGALNTLVTSVLTSVTRATRMSPGQDETCVCELLEIQEPSYLTIEAL